MPIRGHRAMEWALRGLVHRSHDNRRLTTDQCVQKWLKTDVRPGAVARYWRKRTLEKGAILPKTEFREI